MTHIVVITPLALDARQPGAHPDRIEFLHGSLSSVSSQQIDTSDTVTQVLALSGRDRQRAYDVARTSHWRHDVEFLDLGGDCATAVEARNEAIRWLPSDCEYVALLDSDDSIPSTRLRLAVAELRRRGPKCVAISAPFICIDEHGAQLDESLDRNAARLVDVPASDTAAGWLILPTLDKARYLNLCGFVVAASALRRVCFRVVFTSEDMWLYVDLFAGEPRDNRIGLLHDGSVNGSYRLHRYQFSAAGKRGGDWLYTKRAIQVGRDAISSLLDRKCAQGDIDVVERDKLAANYEVVIAVRCWNRAQAYLRRGGFDSFVARNLSEARTCLERACETLAWSDLATPTQRLVSADWIEAKASMTGGHTA